MNRRDALKGIAAGLAASLFPLSVKASDGGHSSPSVVAVAALGKSADPSPEKRNQQIAMLVYPQMTALDMVGPHAFLSGLMNVDVHLVWKNRGPIQTDRGNLSILANTTFEECPDELDILFVGGGLEGTIAVMQDEEVLAFLADRGSRARYVTSVCTGSLILGSAGLLKGYKATSHWAFRDLLPVLGAIPIQKRVVEDRNRITGAGVTSGIDFGLLVAARMADQHYAELLQLVNEYDPQPPFHAGTPEEAGLVVTDELRQMMAAGIASAKSAASKAARKHST